MSDWATDLLFESPASRVNGSKFSISSMVFASGSFSTRLLRWGSGTKLFRSAVSLALQSATVFYWAERGPKHVAIIQNQSFTCLRHKADPNTDPFNVLPRVNEHPPSECVARMPRIWTPLGAQHVAHPYMHDRENRARAKRRMRPRSTSAYRGQYLAR